MTVSRLFQRYGSPAALLDHLLLKIQAGNFDEEVLRPLPELREIAERYVWLVGDRLRLPLVKGGGPIAAEAALVSAIDWLNLASNRWMDGAYALKTVFAAGMLYNAPYLTHLAIEVDGQPWTLSTGTPMGELLGSGLEVMTTIRSDLGERDTDGMSIGRLQILTRMYPHGTHLDLDLDLQQVVFPPLALVREVFGEIDSEEG